MARFCANCGAAMEDGDKVCGQCGTPAVDLDSATDTNEKASSNITIDKSKTTKIIKLAVALIILIVVGVIVANIVSKFTGYNGTLRKMVNALEEDDVDTLDAIASSISEDIYSAWYGDDYLDYYEKAVDEALDKFEDSVGNIKSISYEITDITELSDRRMEDIEDKLTDMYNIDTSSISKINKVEVKLTVKGSKKSASFNVDNLFLIKESGKWKIFYGSLDY